MKDVKPLDSSLDFSVFSSQLKALAENSRRMKKEGKDINEVLKTEGVEGLLNQKKPVGNQNKFSPEIEKTILDYTLQHPLFGQRRVAKELNQQYGWKISEGGVRRVWVRNKLQLTEMRIKAVKKLQSEGVKLSPTQLEALTPMKAKETVKIKDVEADYPGHIIAQEVFYMGEIPGLGKIYQQTAVDLFSGVIMAKAYTSKTSTTAAEFVNSQVLPYFEERELEVQTIQTNRGLAFCGEASTHPFQLFLTIKGIKHKSERNLAGQLLRVRETLQLQFYEVINKKTYRSIDELNEDLFDYVRFYNERASVKTRFGNKTPNEVFQEGVKRYIKNGTTPSHIASRNRWEPKIVDPSHLH